MRKTLLNLRSKWDEFYYCGVCLKWGIGLKIAKHMDEIIPIIRDMQRSFWEGIDEFDEVLTEWREIHLERKKR